MRYVLEIMFDGTNYKGWQIQNNAITVQEVINNALSTLLKEKIMCWGCGRTDTGVHSTQFYLHFDSTSTLDNTLIYKLNSLLPYDIGAQTIVPVNDDFNVRFDALSRTYKYKTHVTKNPFLHNYSLFLKQNPNVELMNNACILLLGEQDFQCFSKVHTQVNNYICTILHAKWEWENNQLIFTITANRFLRNMVRAIVGTLLEIGYNKITETDLVEILKNKNRNNAGQSVAACGLYLTSIKYPKL